MTGQKYRRAMEQIELSPDQREHLVRAMLQEQPRRKRKRAPVRLLLAAALACGVLTISVLALSPALREYLTQALGSFAPYSQELSGATAVDQKVKVRVVSAVTDRYRVKLYVELTDLTGERIVDENTRLSAKIQREAGEDGLRSRCVGYDPETCTALFELNGNMEEGGKYQEQMRLRITQVRPQQYHEYTIETQSMAAALSEDYAQTMELETGEVVLLPGQTQLKLPGLERAEISSLGFMEDGTFHTLFRLPEGAVLDQEGLDGSWLCVDMTVNGEIPCRTVESCCFVRDGIPYLEVIHDHVSLDDLDGISFQGVGGNIVQSEKISGNWEILFQVENMSVRELELTGAAAGSTISSQLILTPLGAMITGEYEKGYWGGQSCAVVYQDGTRMDHTEIEAGRMSPEGVCILGNWTFGEAVDLDRAAALEIGGLWIPLTGADAGVVRAD